MCGIAGIWGDATMDRLRAMADSLRHRGPDDEGFWTCPTEDLGLAHRRLSIIDLESGHQPVFNETGEIVTIFNGEIYNYKELRQELVAKGHRFSTQSDTEVIVHLYEEMGTDLVGRLRGMFAIAIWDTNHRQLVLIRDRVGKKPLYYSEAGGEFIFASEIKGLVAAARKPFTLDEQVLADYLTWSQIHAPATIYSEVRSAEPGELLIVRERRVVSRNAYWQLQMHPKAKLTTQEAVEQADELLREAVRLRMRSDVPVGAFLSGGIDSGIVTAMAAQQYPGTLTTATIGFEDGPFDERPLARLVAERYATDHHEVLVKPDVANDLPTIAAAYDQPFGGPSAVPSFYVARTMRKFVKVALNGDGGDEVFAGYRRYVAARINGYLGWADRPRTRPAWRLLSQLLPVPGRFRSGYAFGHRLIRGLGMDPVDRYLAWTVDVLTDSEKHDLCHGCQGWSNSSGLPLRFDAGSAQNHTDGLGPQQPAVCWLDRTKPGARLARRFLNTLGHRGPVDRMLSTDFSTILPHDLLVKMDIACMAHGLEARSPLLDHVLIDVVSRYPESVKLSGRLTKPILRMLSRRYVPAAIQTAPKRGFEIPVVRWLRDELRELCEDVILSPQGLLADIFHRPGLERLLRGPHELDPARWGRRTWALLMLGMWDQVVR